MTPSRGGDIVLEDVPFRLVVLHYHLMKNAGTTIESILEREFGGAFARVHRASHVGAVEAEDIRAIVREGPRVRALTSHHLRYPVPSLPHAAFFDCCPLRHPIDRLASLHAFYRSFSSDAFPGDLAQATELPEFLDTLLRAHPNYAYNVQTIFLATGGAFRALSDDDLRIAESRVRRSAMPAVVHRLDESLALAEYFLGPAFPGLRLHFVARNVTRPTGEALDTRVAELRERCGPPLYERLERANAFDLRLLAAAEDEIDRRIAAVPDFLARLADFRERCGTLADGGR